MNAECDWDEDTLVSFSEDETIFGPDGVYGWLMNLWYRFLHRHWDLKSPVLP